MQEKVADGSIELNKVGGEANLADALTKHVGRETLERHLEATNQRLIGGRHAWMPQVGQSSHEFTFKLELHAC